MTTGAMSSALRAVAILSVLIGFVFTLTTRNALNDDLVWLYSTSFVIDEPLAFAEARQQVADGLVAIGADTARQYRFALRNGFEDNYRFAMLASYLARILTQPLPDGVDIAADRAARQLLLHRLALTFSLGFGTALALFWLGLRGVKDNRILGSVAVVMLAITLVNFLPGNSTPDAFNNLPYWLNRPLNEGETIVGQMVREAAWFSVHPGPAFVPFELPPKNQFQLVLVAILALRWVERRTAGYVLLAASCVFHHSYAAFIVLLLGTIDAWWRPSWLLRGVPGLLLAIPVLANMIRLAAWNDDWNLTLFGPGLGLAGVFMLAVIRRRWLSPADRPGLLQASPAAAQDLVGFWALWLPSAVVFGLISLVTPPQEALYFWGNIHSRLMGLMLLPTYIGLIVLIAGRPPAIRRWSMPASQAALQKGYLSALTAGLGVAGFFMLRADPSTLLAPEPRLALRSSACEFEVKQGSTFEGSYFTLLVADLELGTTERLQAFFSPCGPQS